MGSDLPRKEASHLISDMSDSPNGPSKENPYHSTLLVNRLMTEGSDKETRHFELCLKDSGIDYLPGDSLGVHPVNCPEAVSDLLGATGYSGSEEIDLGEETLCLQDALSHRLACTVLSRMQVKKFNEIAQVPKLEDLLKSENKEALADYLWGRELIDLFLEFPQQGLEAPISSVFASLAKLYSIASSLVPTPTRS